MKRDETVKITMLCCCLLLASCGQSKAPVLEQPLPFQEKIQALCDTYRTDLYNMAEKAAAARLDSEFKDSLYGAESAAKFLNMLNCKRWTPS
jgi:hypothetical protein